MEYLPTKRKHKKDVFFCVINLCHLESTIINQVKLYVKVALLGRKPKAFTLFIFFF